MSNPASNPYQSQADLVAHRAAAYGQVEAALQTEYAQIAQAITHLNEYAHERYGAEFFDSSAAQALEKLGGEKALPGLQKTLSDLGPEDGAEYVVWLANDASPEEAKRLGAMTPGRQANQFGRVQSRVNPAKANGVVDVVNPHASSTRGKSDEQVLRDASLLDKLDDRAYGERMSRLIAKNGGNVHAALLGGRYRR